MRDLAAWLKLIEARHPTRIDMGLERVTEVLQKLGCDQFSCPVITVAGTNGKGSTIALLASCLQAGGYRVGCYTSPHLLQFNERICINSQMVTDEQITAAFTRIDAARGDVSLSYFEYSTLAALLIFSETNLDVVILEVGLGGRLDAVNCIAADLAIITTIDIDHTEWLGETRESIAREKAGIFRANQSAVIGEYDIPQSMLDTASALGTTLFCQGRDFSWTENGDTWQWCCDATEMTALPTLTLNRQNASTALMALHVLKQRLPLDSTHLIEGLRSAQLAGRFQVIPAPHLLILDVAHNKQSIEDFAKKIARLKGVKKTYAVFSMLEDKQIAASLDCMARLVDEWHIAPLKSNRAASCDLMNMILADLNVTRVVNHLDIAGAYRAALAKADDHSLIIVFGSFYTVADVLVELT